MQNTPTHNLDEAPEAPQSAIMRQYTILRGAAVTELEAKLREQATSRIGSSLGTMGESKAPGKLRHLQVATPQTEIDYIRSLGDKDDTARKEWIDRYIRNLVRSTLEKLARREAVSKLIVGDALVAGLVNPDYRPEGDLEELFSKTVLSHNRDRFFEYGVIRAKKNGLIPADMSAEQATKVLLESLVPIQALYEV